MTLALLKKRLHELELLDKSIVVKHLPRSQWPKEYSKGKNLFWQVPRTSAQFLFTLVSFLKPKTLLELGTSAGYSSLWLASAMPSDAHLYSIEFSDYRFAFARESIARCNLAKSVTLHHGKFAAILEDWSIPIDFLFIDADKPAYLENFIRLEKFFKSGTFIVADNILDSPEKMKSFVNYIQTNSEFSSTIINMDNGLLIARKK